MKIYYDDTGCGNGKTYLALTSISITGGKHIYVCDRVEAMRERSRELHNLMIDAGRTARQELISADQDHRLATRSVTSRVENAARDFAHYSDAVIFITHEAMKLASFEDFAGQGWSIWIDEVPDALDHGKHRFVSHGVS